MALIRSLRSSSLSKPEKWLTGYFGGEPTAAGMHVSEETAMHYSAFFAAVRVVSEDVAGLPLPLYERLSKGKRRATEHSLYPVLHDVANPYMTSMQLRETLQGHAMTWGNGVAYIERNGAGEVDSLWPLRPDRLEIKMIELDKGKFSVAYKYRSGGGTPVILLPDEVLHIAGLGYDGVRGYSIVHHARQSIGLGLATEQYGAAFFGNGSRPGGVLKSDKQVSEPARLRMKADWENLHRGVDRSHRVAILEEGVDWQSIGIPPEDAQFLETRKFQVTDMARWMRVPPHKLGDLERSTFSNIEQQDLDYLKSALRSWLVRWEQAISLRLLTARERSRYFAEHLVDGLLRGDIKSRYEAYAIARNWGWMNADDIREKENLNPLPDGKGEVYLVPLNMVPAPSPDDDVIDGEVVENQKALPAARELRGRGLEARRRIAASFAPLIMDADERLAKLERAEVKSLVRRHLEGDRGARDGSISTFLAVLWELYDAVVRQKTVDRWTPLMQALVVEVVADSIADVGYDGDVNLERWVGAYVRTHADYRVNSAFGQLRAAADSDDPAAAILAKLDEWVEKRPERTAKWETNQLPNAAARETYRSAGVRRLRWVTNGDNCPFCKAMDGRVVGIEEPFVAAGTEVGLAETLKVDRKTFHPPLHPGCDCSVTPD
ncbi:phage portal protein [Amycolatopsis palatopharyngis]|uniref:phage portal protein n=1 Tax=Amycolatopsis palatopharyngis TaxID=187982 RepID=UPI000E2723C4|nr:phage portal protein [Amycolatopsis palatopharyngis]